MVLISDLLVFFTAATKKQTLRLSVLCNFINMDLTFSKEKNVNAIKVPQHNRTSCIFTEQDTSNTNS